MTVESLATRLGIWADLCNRVATFTGENAQALLPQLAQLPIKRSRATRRLGSCASLNGVPVSIRLQFAQEPESFELTFRHEVAHACHQLTAPAGRRSRLAHGPQWQAWARALGTPAKSCGQSETLNDLHRQRLKLVAVCQYCGAEFRRVRRLNRRRKYYHTVCGGPLRPV